MEAADVTAPQMAKALGLAKNTIYAYLSGDRKPPKLGMIKEWARVCNVPWEWIVTGELPGNETPDNLGIYRCICPELVDA